MEIRWETHADFAYCTPDPQGNNKAEFEKVIQELLAADGCQKKLIPKLRRLYTKSYVAVTTAYAEDASSNPRERITMNIVDRAERTDNLRKRLTGFTLDGSAMPSNTLVDLFGTMLLMGHRPVHQVGGVHQ